MMLLGKEVLDQFVKKHTHAKKKIEVWISDVESSEWDTPQGVKNRYSSASFLADNQIIFNIKGNAFRLRVVVHYEKKLVIVKWIGTHAEYDKL